MASDGAPGAVPLLAGMAALLGDGGVQSILLLTGQVALATLLLHLVAGLLLGYALARPAWRGRLLLDLLVTLPLIFPPMAMGFFLLLLFGRHGLFGEFLSRALGVDVVFSFWGLLLAAFIAGLPLVVKPVQAGFAGVSKRLAEAARTLGKNEWQIALFVLLPNIRGALLAGLLLGSGRALGEVGMTLMLGGNIAGRTVTASLEIYNAVLSGEYERAGLLSLLLGLVTAALCLVARLFGARLPSLDGAAGGGRGRD